MDHLANTLRSIDPGAALHAALYPIRKAWAEARWSGPRSPIQAARRARTLERAWPQRWETPGAVRHITPTPRGAVVATDRARLEITFFADDLVRVRWLPHAHRGEPEPVPYAIATPLAAWDPPAVVLVQSEGAFFLRSPALTVGVALDDAQVLVADPDGHLLRADVDTAWAPDGALRHRTALAPDEPIFGLGERATPWNRRGRAHVLVNTDPAGYANGDDPINLNIPVYVGLTPKPYLVFYENPYAAEFSLDAEGSQMAEHRFAGGELRYYLAAGGLPHLLERYTALTGRHALPPLWMLGYQQSRWSYYPEARVRQLAQDFRAHDVPCDALYLDIHYMDGYRCFTWDEDRFPHLPQLAADLREQGFKLVTILDPGIKKDRGYHVYREGQRGDHFCTLPNGEVFHAPVWPGLSAFPDFTSPRTRTWWGELYEPLVEAGIAGFWNDMNEPAAFSTGETRTLPDPVQHELEGRGGDHREAHNVYGMQMARASREGLLRLQPDVRPVVITRAGWAGVQRYATSWTADNESTWEALRLTVPMVLALGLSGLGFTGSDIGGFLGEADGELFTRWIQMGAFMPYFRAHTAAGYPDQEPWSYGEPYLSIVRRFIQLRYELLPYLYTATWQMATRGWPMVRPLWWHEPENAALWDIDDAFLCGDALLVAPVGTPGAAARDVTLPSGGWYDFWTRRLRRGGETFEQVAPLESMPLFVRAGSVLTLGEHGPNVEQRLQKFLRLDVYPLPEPGKAVTELYEDAGTGHAYRAGERRLSRFTLKRESGRVIVHWEREGAYTPPYEHVALTLNGLKRTPQAVRADDHPFPVVTSDPVRHTALLGVPLFERLDIIL
jgi:alpha-glucosidase